MKRDGMMQVEANIAAMWTLSADRRTIRLTLPPLRLGDMPEPVKVFMDFDAATVDEIIDRLMVLRGRMLPPPAKPNRRN